MTNPTRILASKNLSRRNVIGDQATESMEGFSPRVVLADEVSRTLANLVAQALVAAKEGELFNPILGRIGNE